MNQINQQEGVEKMSARQNRLYCERLNQLRNLTDNSLNTTLTQARFATDAYSVSQQYQNIVNKFSALSSTNNTSCISQLTDDILNCFIHYGREKVYSYLTAVITSSSEYEKQVQSAFTYLVGSPVTWVVVSKYLSFHKSDQSKSSELLILRHCGLSTFNFDSSDDEELPSASDLNNQHPSASDLNNQQVSSTSVGTDTNDGMKDGVHHEVVFSKVSDEARSCDGIMPSAGVLNSCGTCDIKGGSSASADVLENCGVPVLRRPEPLVVFETKLERLTWIWERKDASLCMMVGCNTRTTTYHCKLCFELNSFRLRANYCKFHCHHSSLHVSNIADLHFGELLSRSSVLTRNYNGSNDEEDIEEIAKDLHEYKISPLTFFGKLLSKEQEEAIRKEVIGILLNE